jgi:hypothetical protein
MLIIWKELFLWKELKQMLKDINLAVNVSRINNNSY